MANHRTASIDNGEVGQAAREGLAEGFRLALPIAIALVLVGAPICAYLAFSHFALGVDWVPLPFAGAMSAVSAATAATIARHRS